MLRARFRVRVLVDLPEDERLEKCSRCDSLSSYSVQLEVDFHQVALCAECLAAALVLALS